MAYELRARLMLDGPGPRLSPTAVEDIKSQLMGTVVTKNFDATQLVGRVIRVEQNPDGIEVTISTGRPEDNINLSVAPGFITVRESAGIAERVKLLELGLQTQLTYQQGETL